MSIGEMPPSMIKQSTLRFLHMVEPSVQNLVLILPHLSSRQWFGLLQLSSVFSSGSTWAQGQRPSGGSIAGPRCGSRDDDGQFKITCEPDEQFRITIDGEPNEHWQPQGVGHQCGVLAKAANQKIVFSKASLDFQT